VFSAITFLCTTIMSTTPSSSEEEPDITSIFVSMPNDGVDYRSRYVSESLADGSLNTLDLHPVVTTIDKLNTLSAERDETPSEVRGRDSRHCCASASPENEIVSVVSHSSEKVEEVETVQRKVLPSWYHPQTSFFVPSQTSELVPPHTEGAQGPVQINSIISGEGISMPMIYRDKRSDAEVDAAFMWQNNRHFLSQTSTSHSSGATYAQLFDFGVRQNSSYAIASTAPSKKEEAVVQARTSAQVVHPSGPSTHKDIHSLISSITLPREANTRFGKLKARMRAKNASSHK
jgi:hypothetical protein